MTKGFKTEKISISNNDKIGLITNFTTMLNAGIPILEVIDSLLEDSKGNMRKFLMTLRDDLMQGQRVNVSFARFPKIFDKVTVNIIKAAEEGGTLAIALQDLKDNVKKEQEFTDKIKSALIYPVFIMIVFVAVMLMILIVVVPKISTVFLRLKVDLPLPTQILIFLSNTLLNQTLYVSIGAAILIGFIVYMFKQQKQFLIHMLTSLPMISNLSRQIDITRFCRSLHLLLGAGLPIVGAIELTEQVVSTKEVKALIHQAREMVSSGKKLTEGLKSEKKVFPSIIIKILEAGEKTGSLDQSMQEAADFLDYQVSGTLKTLTALIEPLMLVMVGVMIGGMMLAIIAPIYGLIGNVGGHH